MKPLLVGIAGGTGAGKSTLAHAFEDREPERYAVVRLDDYYKADIPWIDGIRNWERPEALDFDAAYADLTSLTEGRSVTVRGLMPQYGPNQEKTGETPYEYRVDPKPIVLFEGFLALYDPRIRSLLYCSLFLSIPIEESLKRRMEDANKYSTEAYFKDVLVPAHREFVAPTQALADFVIDVRVRTPEEVYTKAHEIIEDILSKRT